MSQVPESPFDCRTMTASELQILLRASSVTSTKLIDIYLRQIEKYNGYLKAVISTAPRDDLLNRAQQLDAERAAGRERSSLHGIPILIKDNIATHPALGMDTTAGSLALVGSRPKRNADIVDKLIEAGALIIGKANLSELSYFKGEDLFCGWSAVGGQSQSAYVRGGMQEDDTPAGHSNPGGSSSGSAIAVSAGLASISIGTETSASLVSPSSKAALYTIKPTIGLVSQSGIVPISSICDTAGPMTKSVLDLANIMDIIVDPSKTTIPEGGYTSVFSSSWADLRVGVLDPAIWGTTDEGTRPGPGATKQIRQAFDEAYEDIKREAKSFRKFVPLPTADDLKVDGKLTTMKLFTGHYKRELETYLQDLDFTQVHSLEELIKFNRDHADRELPALYPNQDRLEGALTHGYTEEVLDAAFALARNISRTEGIDKILQDYDIDVIIGPAESPMSTLAATSGYPIATMPLGYLDYNGRPFGMAALASAHQEAILIKVQSVWESTFPPRQPPPYAVFSS